MCLAIPGKIIEIADDGPLVRSGTVSFGGISRTVNLSTVPKAGVGDYVLVHAGLAISLVDPVEAAKTLELIAQASDSYDGDDER